MKWIIQQHGSHSKAAASHPSRSEKLDRIPQSLDKGIHLCTRVVYVEARSGRRADFQVAVQRLGAVMAAADTDPRSVEQRRDIGRVQAADVERGKGGAAEGGFGGGAVDDNVVNCCQTVIQVGTDLLWQTGEVAQVAAGLRIDVGIYTAMKVYTQSYTYVAHLTCKDFDEGCIHKSIGCACRAPVQMCARCASQWTPGSRKQHPGQWPRQWRVCRLQSAGGERRRWNGLETRRQSSPRPPSMAPCSPAAHTCGLL